MKMDRKKAIILAVILVAATAFAVGGQQGPLIGFIENLTGLEESDRKIMESIDLGNLPDYFEASVIIEGSKYTGQLHTVDLNISHIRPGSSVWLADGDYSLELEYLNGTPIGGPIMVGSFIDIDGSVPFSTPTASWTPTCPNGTYFIALSLTDLEWISGYIINATAGSGGTISPFGLVTVREGGSLSFSIEADEGYVIEDVTDNGVSTNPPAGSASDTHMIIYIKEDHTIVASFVHNTVAEYSSGYTYVERGIEWTVYNATYNGDANHTYLGGETINYVVNAKNSGVAFTELTYSVQVKYHELGLVSYVTLLNETITYDPIIALQADFTIIGSFVQPSGENGYWDLLIKITGSTS